VRRVDGSARRVQTIFVISVIERGELVRPQRAKTTFASMAV
jgi:hypothetical protein